MIIWLKVENNINIGFAKALENIQLDSNAIIGNRVSIIMSGIVLTITCDRNNVINRFDGFFVKYKWLHNMETAVTNSMRVV